MADRLTRLRQVVDIRRGQQLVDRALTARAHDKLEKSKSDVSAKISERDTAVWRWESTQNQDHIDLAMGSNLAAQLVESDQNMKAAFGQKQEAEKNYEQHLQSWQESEKLLEHTEKLSKREERHRCKIQDEKQTAEILERHIAREHFYGI